MMRRLDARTVVVLADAQGYVDLAGDLVERVATGADRAVRAVRDSVSDTLFDGDPAAFLAVLEALAEDEPAP